MTEAPDTQPLPQPATAGALLREAREARGIPIEKLASSIKISVQQLRDLEDDHYDRLSDAAFVRALAMSVCRSLGIDPQAALSMLPAPASVQVLESVNRGINAPFEAEGGAGMMVEAWQALRGLRGPVVLVAVVAVVAWLSWPRLQSLQSPGTSPAALPASQTASQPASEALQPLGPAASPVAGVAGVAGTVVPASGAPSPGGSASQSQTLNPAGRGAGGATASAASAAPSGPRPSSVAASTPAAVPNAAVVAAVVIRPAPKAAVVAIPPAARPSTPLSAPLPAPTGAAAPLTVTARDSSWVEVRDALGHILLSRLMGAHESVSLRGATPLSVTVGNAPVTDLSFNGHAVDLASYTHDHVAHLELK